MEKTSKKPVYILLKPEDFINTNYCSPSNCALARAVNRHFKVKTASVDDLTVDIDTHLTTHKRWDIKDAFAPQDYEFVESEYKKHPKKYKYYVTLLPR